MLDPHSLQVADFDGDGRPDIYVGDMLLAIVPSGGRKHPLEKEAYRREDACNQAAGE